MATTTTEDHAATARDHIRKADDWANRDNVDPDYRPVVVDYHLRLAQIHATLAVSQRIDDHAAFTGGV